MSSELKFGRIYIDGTANIPQMIIGVRGYLQKPFTKHQIATLLANMYVHFKKRIQQIVTAIMYNKIYKAYKIHEWYISLEIRKKITIHHSKQPHLYGRCSIKANNDSRKLPSTELMKFLLMLVQPLEEESPTYFKISQQFLEILKWVSP